MAETIAKKKEWEIVDADHSRPFVPFQKIYMYVLTRSTFDFRYYSMVCYLT